MAEVSGFTEFLKGRVALPLSGSLPDFERVLHHELVHIRYVIPVDRGAEGRTDPLGQD